MCLRPGPTQVALHRSRSTRVHRQKQSRNTARRTAAAGITMLGPAGTSYPVEPPWWAVDPRPTACGRAAQRASGRDRLGSSCRQDRRAQRISGSPPVRPTERCAPGETTCPHLRRRGPPVGLPDRRSPANWTRSGAAGAGPQTLRAHPLRQLTHRHGDGGARNPLTTSVQQVAEGRLLLLGGHEQQLVTDLEGRRRWRRSPGPPEGSRRARCRRATPRRPGHAYDVRVMGKCHLHQVRLALPEGEQAYEVADRDRFLNECAEQSRREHRHVHTPHLVEQPLVLRVVRTGDHSRYAVFGLGQQQRPPG